MAIDLIYNLFLNKLLIISIDIIAVFLAFLVYRNNPRGKINKIYLLMTFLMMCWVTFAYIPRLIGQTNYELALSLLKVAWFVTPLFFSLLYLITIYLIEEAERYKILTRLILICGSVLAFLAGFTNFIIYGFRPFDSVLRIEYGTLMISFLAGISFLIIATLFPIFKKKTLLLKERRIQFFLIGLFLFYLLNGIFNIALPLIFNISRFYFLGDYSTLILLGFISFAIVKYQLFEIRVILTEFLVGVMGLIWLVFIFLMSTFSLRILAFGSFFLFCIFGYYLINATHEEEKRREEAERLAIQEMALREKAERFKIVSTKLKEKLSEVLELELILSNIKEVLAETLQTKKFSFAHKQPATGFYEIRKINGFQKEEPSSIIIQTPLCAYLKKEKEILTQEKLTFLIGKEKDESEKEKMGSILQKLKESEIHLVLPLFQKDAIVGIFFLGPKLSDQSYTQEDIELLEGLSYQMAISIQNSLLYEEIKKEKEVLEKFYKLTVGRELKMAELKQEIKDLEERLKEKERDDKMK